MRAAVAGAQKKNLRDVEPVRNDSAHYDIGMAGTIRRDR
jgi:hypothetical protein